jgi:uncharacterized SAM-binding protein YcdF (DUF218 family)
MSFEQLPLAPVLARCDAVVVLGKRPTPGQPPVEVTARAALGALLWHAAPPGTLLVCLEGYTWPGSTRSGARYVRQVAAWAGVPPAQIVARSLANCTIREVEFLAAVLAEQRRTHPLVVTHPYHVPRTRRYLRQVGLLAPVVPCTPGLARRLPGAARHPHLLRAIAQGHPRGWARLHNALSECALVLLHACDPPGYIERRLADQLRGDGLPIVR